MSKKQSNSHTHTKHQNKFAYKITFNDNYNDMTKQARMDHLCERCVQQIQWKIQYGKYKKITQLARCIKCTEKNIQKSYRSVCDPCANKLKICSKCSQPVDDFHKTKETEKKGIELDQGASMQDYMKGLREGSRRKILRLIDKKLISWWKEKEGFYYKEDHSPVDGLRFKNNAEDMSLTGGLDGLDDDDLDDDDLDGLDDDEDEDDLEELENNLQNVEIDSGPVNNKIKTSSIEINNKTKKQGIHKNVRCDVSNMKPILGIRYHKIGTDYDLCEAEFAKLSQQEKNLFESIDYPGQVPVPVRVDQQSENPVVVPVVESQENEENKDDLFGDDDDDDEDWDDME